MSREAVVVGSGLGGLAWAAARARAGVPVTGFEQHDEPGGYATSFTRDGFEHEVSLHVLDAVGPGEPNHALLQQLDIAHRLELLEAPSVRREIWPAEGLDLWLPPELEDLLVYLTELAPVDGPGVRALFDLASRVHARCYDAVDAGRLNLDRGSRDIHALLDRTAREVIDEHVADPRLRRLLGTLANYQGLPASRIAALPFLLMLWGYHGCSALYPKGGSRALTAALVASIEEHGGTVRCGVGVARIDARRGRVRGVELEDGTRADARWVVSNASPLTTF
ncbi:MAG: NAD(P)/FAD-dependent oxidoreductase, partial [Myxococcales bacterium]|nr:NAD(P)/FAD-dependent oxidoreductase [Myxococcales bacterium]